MGSPVTGLKWSFPPGNDSCSREQISLEAAARQAGGRAAEVRRLRLAKTPAGRRAVWAAPEPEAQTAPPQKLTEDEQGQHPEQLD